MLHRDPANQGARQRLGARRLLRQDRRSPQRRQHDLQGQGRAGATTWARSRGIARRSRRRRQGATSSLPLGQLQGGSVPRRAPDRLPPRLLPAVRSRPRSRQARTRSSCASTGATRGARPSKASTARGSTGAGSTARSTCARSARATCRRRRIADDAAPRAPRGDREGRRAGAQQRPRPHRRAGRLARPRRRRRSPSRSRPGALAHGQDRRPSRRRRPSPQPALWSPADPNLYSSTSPCPARAATPRASACASSPGADRHMFLNGRGCACTAPRIQEDAPGHGDALTPGDQDRLVAELKAIGANAVRAQHPLDPALLERLDAAGHPRLAGRRPGRRRRQVVLEHAARCCRSRAAGAHGRVAARCTRRSSPGTSSTRSPATGATPRRSRYVQTTHADGCTSTTRRAWSPWTSGASTRRRTPGALYAESTPSPRPTTPAGMTSARQPDAQQRARDARAPARAGAHVRRQGAGDQRVRRRIEHAQPAGRARQLRLPVGLLARHIAVYAADPKLSGDARLGAARLPAGARPSAAARSTACSRTCA